MAERTLTVKILGDSRSLEKAFTKSARAGHTFSSQMKTVTRSTGGFSRGFLSGAGALSSFGGALALTSGSFFAGAGLVAGLKAAVNAAGDFQQTLNVLQQVSGATADQMAAASAEARRLGADITLPSTSASDAALAMQQLAKGGLTVEQAMGAARGTLQLAAAAQTDVATAANTTARALTAFGLSGSNAGDIADALANAANAATGDIVDFAIGLAQSGQSAHQFGLSAQDTVTALTELARAGLVGSDAGTSLRVMLSRLLPASKQAKTEINKLKISVHDAAGNFLPFPQIIAQYNKALAGLSPAQRQFELQTIFGTDAQRAANIILGTSVETYNKLYGVVTRQGGAAKAAAAQQKGFKGALDGFNSALQTTEVTIGTELLPALTRYLRSSAAWLGDSENQARIQKDVKDALRVTSDVLGVARDAFKKLKGIVKAVDDVTGGFKQTLELLLGIKIASTLVGWSREMKIFGGATSVAAGRSATLLGNLRALSTLGPIGITIAVAVEDIRNPKSIGDRFNFLKKLPNSVVDALKQTPETAGVGAVIEVLQQFDKNTKKTSNKVADTLRVSAAKVARETTDFGRVVARSITTSGDVVNTATAQSKMLFTPQQRNTFFDNAIARILLRGGLGSISTQIAALQRANSLIAARIKVTKDVTRRLNLEDELLQNAAQIKDLRAQQAADALKNRQDVMQEFIANLQLGVTRAAATSSFRDDLSALRALQSGIQKEIKEFGRTADLAGQLFDVQQQIKQVQQQRLSARIFGQLGLNATGGERTPTLAGLRRRLSQQLERASAVTLPKKFTTMLANIRKALSNSIVPPDVRDQIRQMMDDIADELKKHHGQMTKFAHANSDAILKGLGLSPEQIRALRPRLAQIGAGGTVPGARTAAFAGAGRDATIHTAVYLDGRVIADAVTPHQRRHQQRRSESRRGPYAGRH